MISTTRFSCVANSEVRKFRSNERRAILCTKSEENFARLKILKAQVARAPNTLCAATASAAATTTASVVAAHFALMQRSPLTFNGNSMLALWSCGLPSLAFSCGLIRAAVQMSMSSRSHSTSVQHLRLDRNLAICKILVLLGLSCTINY